jgi:hypothetical protein
MYERFHAELKRLHDATDVPYLYVEWRRALRAVVPRAALTNEFLSHLRGRL